MATAKTYSNILKYGTQAAYEALATKDASVLYFTDAGKLYKGSVDITNSTRVVSSKPTNPIAGLTYVISNGNGTSVETWDGSAWHVISYPIATTINASSTDTEVATAKAVYTAINNVTGNVGDLNDLETVEKGTIVGAINEVNTIANDNATAIGVASTEETPGSGIIKDIEDLNAEIDALGTAAHSDVAVVPIGSEAEAEDALPTVAQVSAYVKAEVADLEGAMHFMGAVTPTEGQSDEDAMNAWYTAASKKPAKGDVFVITTNTKEYVVSDVTGNVATYKEIGAEGLYVLKTTTIAGVDLQDNITKSEMLSALNVADGAQVNVLEGVQVNGTALQITDKVVNVTVVTGTENGTIKVNGTDVAVKGLGSAAYTDATAYDEAGKADELVGALASLSTDAKSNAVAAINEVDGNANAAQEKADQNEADLAALAVAVAWGTFGA